MQPMTIVDVNRRRQLQLRQYDKILRLLVYDKETLLHTIVVGDPMPTR